MSGESYTKSVNDTPPRPPVLVVGLGNILLSDEGVGVRVIEAMQPLDLPTEVELLDGGTAALDVLELIKGRRKVIFIDAVKGGGSPGTLYCFRPEDITAQKQVSTSLHQIGLMEMLPLAELSGQPPREIVILGVEPAKLSAGLELSDEVAKVIPRLIELVRQEFTASEDTESGAGN